MNKNSKTGIILGVVAVIVVLLSFLLTTVDGTGSGSSASIQQIIANAQQESAAVIEEERKELIEISVDQYLEYYEGSEEKLIMVGSSQCGYCAIAQPIIENLAYKYNINIYYLDAATFSDDDESKFVKSNEYFNAGFGTPMLIYVGNKKLIDIVDGLVDTDSYLEFLKNNKLINE